jgi:hypothetical protein
MFCDFCPLITVNYTLKWRTHGHFNMFWVCAFHILRQAKPCGGYAEKKRAEGFGFLITASADCRILQILVC